MMDSVLCVCFSVNIVVVTGILGGTEISIEKAPYQVNYGDICGGVLIHQKWALTTAHCGTRRTFIRVGSKYRLQGRKVEVIKHIQHPKFGHKHVFDYDVQLLVLRRPLYFSNKVKSIELSTAGCGQFIYVTGWGYPAENGEFKDTLQQVRLELVSKTHCQDIDKEWYDYTLTDRMFCAGEGWEDACQGDSGGAAVSMGRLVGLSSFGYGCGRYIPGVYTNLSDVEIRPWIRRLTGV